MKPLIGITVDGVASATVNPHPHFRLRQLYAEAVEKAGGIPVLLPWSMDSVSHYANLISGLIVTGGDDIDPTLYGEKDIHPSVTLVFPERTQFEWAMLEAMSALGKPILGICGGMQLMNVWAGGTLYQDISFSPGCETHEQGRGRFFSHPIDVKKDSFLKRVAGQESVYVNSFHHQIIKDVAPKWRATAWSEDGCVEAIESSENQGVIGVQWHPEYGDGIDTRLMREWVNLCKL